MLILISLSLASAPPELQVPSHGTIVPVAGSRIQWIDAHNAQSVYVELNQERRVRGPVDERVWPDLNIIQDGWWVLPEDGGVAVQATVTAVEFETPGECGGYSGISVVLSGPRAVAAIHGEPPSTWHEVVPGPDLDLSQRLDAWMVNTHSEHLPERSRWVSFATHGDIAHVRVADVLHVEGPPDTFGYSTLQTDLRFDAQGIHELDRSTYYQFAPTQTLQGLRDVNGDGVLDVIESGCMTTIRSTDDAWSVAELQSTCCGC